MFQLSSVGVNMKYQRGRGGESGREGERERESETEREREREREREDLADNVLLQLVK